VVNGSTNWYLASSGKLKLLAKAKWHRSHRQVVMDDAPDRQCRLYPFRIGFTVISGKRAISNLLARYKLPARAPTDGTVVKTDIARPRPDHRYRFDTAGPKTSARLPARCSISGLANVC
jgi:hypothetical protein